MTMLKRLSLPLLLLILVGSALSCLAWNRTTISAKLYDLTGETDEFDQVRGLAHWLSGYTRPLPQTADDVPIAHNGVNPFGVNTFLNQEVEDKKVVRQLDLIRDAGFKWIRQEFPWEDIEIHAKGDFQDRRNQPPRSAWTKYDRIVQLANERGIQVIARLSTPPRWSRKAENLRAETPPDRYEDFGDFVAAVAQRYRGQIKFYQIWNEPNVYPEWGDQDISPEDYTRLLKLAYTRAKERDPDCVIIMAPLAATIELGGRDLNDFIFLQRMYDAGAKDYFDILSVNTYGLWSGPTDQRMRPRVINFSRPIYIRDLMVKNGDQHKALWASEIGWNALPKDHPAPPAFGRASDEQVAQFAVTAYQRAQAEWPWMGVMAYWFFKRASDAELNQPFYFFRMLEPDFRPLPVYDALKRYATQVPLIYPGYFQEDHWALNLDGQWPLVSDKRAVLSKYRQSARLGDSLSFTFIGTGLDIVFVQGLAGGIAKITLDDRPLTEIKLESTTETLGVKTPIARNLTPGQHKVRIEVAAPVVGVDGIIVYR